jgi:hypothetical protein
MKIENFKLINSVENYSNTENTNKLNVFELSPDSVCWSYDNQPYGIKNENKLYALLLKDENQIAVIEGLFNNAHDNKAYIVDGRNQKIWDIASLFHSLYNNFLLGKRVIFIEVYYISNELNFFVSINNVDYRFAFDPQSGNIGKLFKSR